MFAELGGLKVPLGAAWHFQVCLSWKRFCRSSYLNKPWQTLLLNVRDTTRLQLPDSDNNFQHPRSLRLLRCKKKTKGYTKTRPEVVNLFTRGLQIQYTFTAERS
jgi:hypothetical protein